MIIFTIININERTINVDREVQIVQYWVSPGALRNLRLRARPLFPRWVLYRDQRFNAASGRWESAIWIPHNVFV